MTKTKTYTFIVLNSLFLAIFYFLYTQNLIQTAWEYDLMFIVPSIGVMTILGLACVLFDRQQYAIWCQETSVILGFIGTALGIYFAFFEVDFNRLTDASQIVTVMGPVLHRLGEALWTTITGAFSAVWISANLTLVGSNE